MIRRNFEIRVMHAKEILDDPSACSILIQYPYIAYCQHFIYATCFIFAHIILIG